MHMCTYLHLSAHKCAQVCMLIHTDRPTCPDTQTLTHAHSHNLKNQSRALQGPRPLCVYRSPLLSSRGIRYFKLQGQVAAPGLWPCGREEGTEALLPVPVPLVCEQAGDYCSLLCRDLPFFPHPSINPQPGGHGEMTTTSTTFAVRRLHLDWPCHLWKKGVWRGQGQQLE